MERVTDKSKTEEEMGKFEKSYGNVYVATTCLFLSSFVRKGGVKGGDCTGLLFVVCPGWLKAHYLLMLCMCT